MASKKLITNDSELLSHHGRFLNVVSSLLVTRVDYRLFAESTLYYYCWVLVG